MKIPKRIVGFLDMRESKFPFEFDKNTFELKLYFPTEDVAYEQIFEGIKIYISNSKEHKWIDKIIIKGKTSEGYLVYFGTSNNPDSYNGYRTYMVDWCYVTDEKQEFIDEIRFYGREIGYFYNSACSFQKEIKYKNDKYLVIDSMNVQTVNNEALNCGCYTSGEIQIDVFCDSYATINYQSSVPLDSTSFLKMKFSEKISLDEMINKARTVRTFFIYVCYRTNIEFTDISTYVKTEDDKVKNCGKLIFNTDSKEERNEKAQNRIIKAEYLKEHVSNILKAIDDGEMSFGHYCSSVEDTSHYPISRIIMILSTFEREFRNIYGQDVRRSKEYIDTKAQVVELIEKYAETRTGKPKKYVREFAKGIQNHDSSYGDNFKYALVDCKGIMEPFVTRYYNGTYEDIIEDISISVNGLRNGVAHSRLDMKLEAHHLTDIKIVEEMLYAVRLKSIGTDETIIKKVINELFGENIAL